MSPIEEVDPNDPRPLVLVIDDELGPRESLRYLLKEECRVLCSDSVDRGLYYAREHKPDVVIMDIRMPGRSGLDGLREIRAGDSDAAVIMLTGFAALGTAQEAIRLEANEYLEKPFDAAEMRAVVQRHIEQTRLRRTRAKLLSNADELNRRILELEEKSRLVELGQSSAEFVHDLRNVVSTVSAAALLLREEFDDLQKAHGTAAREASEHLDLLESGMRRCVDLLDTWQRLIHQTPQQQAPFRLIEFLRVCEKESRPALNAAQAHVSLETTGGDADLYGDRIQLGRVLANLVQNAAHALPPEGGRIHIRADVLDSSVRVSVTDNGCGISQENMPHIFEANFTTRRFRGCMGLGLFIAQKIAQAHGGKITVESAVGKGSTFTLHLPRPPAVTSAASA